MSSKKVNRPINERESILDSRIKRHESVQKMVEATNKKLKGKRLVPHPTMPKTYIYV